MWALCKSGHTYLVFLLEPVMLPFLLFFPPWTSESQTSWLSESWVSFCQWNKIVTAFFQFTDNKKVNGWNIFHLKVFLHFLHMLLFVCPQKSTDYKNEWNCNKYWDKTKFLLSSTSLFLVDLGSNYSFKFYKYTCISCPIHSLPFEFLVLPFKYCHQPQILNLITSAKSVLPCEVTRMGDG